MKKNKDHLKDHLNKRQIVIIWFVVVILAISSLVFPEYLTLTKENRSKAYKSSDMLINEIEHIIFNNDEDKRNLEAFLKETYRSKVKTACYIIDAQPEIENDVFELKKLAHMMGVDEIHLFDLNGKIYSGTVPEYYGLGLDSGKQMAFFKPMLKDRTLTMSQDVVPNTAENKRMMYAMCWNIEGTRMVQIGVNGSRFPKILNGNQIETIIAKIPGNKSTDIILTDAGSSTIRAATKHALIGKDLEDIGIRLNERDYSSRMDFETGFKENPIYCSAQKYDGYRIIIAQYKNVVNETVPVTLITFTEYLILVFIIMSIVLNFLYDKFMQEKTFALKDQLTNLYNRREYEDTLAHYRKSPMESDLVFISMDVNGLKQVNDEQGHDAGDKLLKGAASCLDTVFGKYGKTFRVGGDEFAAIIYTDKFLLSILKEDFIAAQREWSQKSEISLVISTGYAPCADYPDADIMSLAKTADTEMYDAKARYYSLTPNNRRRRRDERQ